MVFRLVIIFKSMNNKYIIILFCSVVASFSFSQKIGRITPEVGLKFPYVGFTIGANVKVVSALEMGVGVDLNATYTLGRWFEVKYFVGESFKGCQFKKNQFFISSQLNSSSSGKYLDEYNEKFSTYKISEGLYLNFGGGYRRNSLLKNDKVVGGYIKTHFQGAIKSSNYVLIEGVENVKIERSLNRNLGNYFFISIGFYFVL